MDNQDNFYMNGILRDLDRKDVTYAGESSHRLQYFSVCDGMGGESAGEQASFLAVKELKEAIHRKRPVEAREVILSANKRICVFQKENDFQSGTTFTGIFLDGTKAVLSNVGDSRIYHIGGRRIRQMSRDDTEYQTLLEAGMIGQNGQNFEHTKSRLLQYLGIPGDEMQIMPHIRRVDLKERTGYLLLCSDGLHGALSDHAIGSLVLEETCTLQERCEKLVKTAIQKGSRDNITVLLIRFMPDETETSGLRRIFGAFGK
jgi:protein phosphatase